MKSMWMLEKTTSRIAMLRGILEERPARLLKEQRNICKVRVRLLKKRAKKPAVIIKP